MRLGNNKHIRRTLRAPSATAKQDSTVQNSRSSKHETQNRYDTTHASKLQRPKLAVLTYDLRNL